MGVLSGNKEEEERGKPKEAARERKGQVSRRALPIDRLPFDFSPLGR